MFAKGRERSPEPISPATPDESPKRASTEKTLRVRGGLKHLRRASGDWLSIVSFLGGQDTISQDPVNRRHSTFYMEGGR